MSRKGSFEAPLVTWYLAFQQNVTPMPFSCVYGGSAHVLVGESCPAPFERRRRRLWNSKPGAPPFPANFSRDIAGIFSGRQIWKPFRLSLHTWCQLYSPVMVLSRRAGPPAVPEMLLTRFDFCKNSKIRESVFDRKSYRCCQFFVHSLYVRSLCLYVSIMFVLYFQSL